MTSGTALARSLLRWLLAAIYIVAGIAHLRAPEAFLTITPEWVPAPRTVIAITGLCECVGALALLTTKFRRMAGIMLAIYAICVFPANIKHALDHVVVWPIPDTWWYHGPRLAFQPVFVWWALFAAGVVNWPAGRVKS